MSVMALHDDPQQQPMALMPPPRIGRHLMALVPFLHMCKNCIVYMMAI